MKDRIDMKQKQNKSRVSFRTFEELMSIYIGTRSTDDEVYQTGNCEPNQKHDGLTKKLSC